MAGTLKRIAGPAYLSNSAANVYTPPASTISTTIQHIHLANVTSASHSFSLYVGATGGSAGGTQLFEDVTIEANDFLDYYCDLFMASTDFLSGSADASSSIVITVEGTQAVV